MAVTPVYSWPTPDNTDLVRDGAEAIRDLGNAIDTTVSTLPTGGFELLASGSLTGLTSVNVTGLPATYKKLFITANNLTASSSDVTVRVNSVSSGYNSFSCRLGSTTIDSMPATGAFNTLRINSTPTSYFVCEVRNLSVPAGQGRVVFDSYFFSASFSANSRTFANVALAAALSSLQIVVISGGAFTNGDYEVWGMK